MKNIMAVMMFIFFSFNIPHIYAYDQYFNGDTNYEFAYSHMDSGFYIDKNSIQSTLYKPPYYRLSALIYSTNTKRDYLSYPSKVTYLYNFNTKDIYECSSTGSIHILRTDYHASEHDKRAILAAIVIWNNAYQLQWQE